MTDSILDCWARHCCHRTVDLVGRLAIEEDTATDSLRLAAGEWTTTPLSLDS